MSTEGFSGLSVDALVTTVGTTRPAFYRRYANVAHLAFDVILGRFGIDAPPQTGSLADDLLQLQRAEVKMFADPLLRKNLPGLLESVRIDESVRALYQEQFVEPRRANVAAAVDRAVARGEMHPSPEQFDFVCDLLLGPILTRALVPTPHVRLDDELARQTVDAALRILRA